MNTLKLIQLYNHVPYFFLIFFRISSFIGAFPMFSMTTVPKRILIFLSLLLSFFVWSVYPLDEIINLFSFEGFELALNQVMIGLTSGFIFTIIFNLFIYVGEIIAMQTGLGFASLIDPKISQLNLLGQYYWLATTSFFLVQNGHLKAIAMLVQSFEVLPITASVLNLVKIKFIIEFGSILFSGTLLIALPLVISLLAVNIIFSVMSRAVPQLNILSITLPIILILGLGIAYISFQTIMGNAEEFFEHGFRVLKTFLGGTS